MVEPQPGIAQVDTLAVLVLVDNVTDALSTSLPNVRSELARQVANGLDVLSGKAICCAHHGLSLVLRVEVGGRARTLLFDAGPEDLAVARNGERLRVDFGAVEAPVLSHGHWDHGGGMLEAVRRVDCFRTFRDRVLGSRVEPSMRCRGLLDRRGRQGRVRSRYARSRPPGPLSARARCASVRSKP